MASYLCAFQLRGDVDRVELEEKRWKLLFDGILRWRDFSEHSEYVGMDLRDMAARMTVDEIVELLARQSALELQVGAFGSQIEEKNDLIAQLNGKIQEQEQQLDWFKRPVFGSRTERRILEASPGSEQLWPPATFLQGTRSFGTPRGRVVEMCCEHEVQWRASAARRRPRVLLLQTHHALLSWQPAVGHGGH